MNRIYLLLLLVTPLVCGARTAPPMKAVSGPRLPITPAIEEAVRPAATLMNRTAVWKRRYEELLQALVPVDREESRGPQRPGVGIGVSAVSRSGPEVSVYSGKRDGVCLRQPVPSGLTDAGYVQGQG